MQLSGKGATVHLKGMKFGPRKQVFNVNRLLLTIKPDIIRCISEFRHLVSLVVAWPKMWASVQ